MPALVHNLGLELPVFDEATPVAWTREQIQATSASADESFVRRTRLEASGIYNLREALLTADDVLQTAAEHFDAALVSYTWGLYRGRYSDDDPHHILNSSHAPVPFGYSLVAEVAAVSDAAAPDVDMQVELRTRTADYFEQARSLGRGARALYDMHPGQFVVESHSNIRWLVDIEPHLRRAELIK